MTQQEEAQPKATPKRRRSPLPAMVSGLAVMVPALLVMLLVLEATAMPYQSIERTAVAATSTPDAAPKTVKKKQGIFDAMFAALTGGPRPSKKPIDYLPAAVEGWSRVDQQSVTDPEFLARFQAAWPDNALMRLDQHPGKTYLDGFIDHYAKPDFHTNVFSKTRSLAIYMQPDGRFMMTRIEFLSEKDNLGPADDPDTWIAEVAERQKDELKRAEMIEHNSLAGFPVTNRTRAAGTNPLFQPIGDNYDRQVAMKLAVPLTHRVLVTVEGYAKPTDVAAQLADFDLSTLQTLLD